MPDAPGCPREHIGPNPDGALDPAGVLDEPARFFASAIPIPGVMHILHNAAKDVTDNMPGFKTFWEPFSVFCKFMKKKPNRDRVIGRCFNTPPASWSAEDICFLPQTLQIPVGGI